MVVFPTTLWSLGLLHNVLGSTEQEFCRRQISMRFGSQDWGAPIQLVWAVEKEGSSILLIVRCERLMTVFGSRLKDIGNCIPKRNINDRQNSETVFITINYVLAMDCWLVKESVCLYWFCCSRHLTPTGLRTFLGRDHVSVQFLQLRLMHFLLMALLWWISPCVHALMVGVTSYWLWKCCKYWYVWRSQYEEGRNYSWRIILGWRGYLPLMSSTVISKWENLLWRIVFPA